MTEIIEKQIKNVKKSCVIYGLFSLLFAPWLIAIVVAICFKGVGDTHKIVVTAITLAVIGTIAGVFLNLFFKHFSVYRKLRKARGKDLEKLEIECTSVKLMKESRSKHGSYVIITGLTLIGADNKK